MVWEVVLWCGLAWAGAMGIPALTAWLGRQGGEAGREAARGLAWLHLLPLYLALITGAVSGRDAGLYGQDASRWASGAIACVVVLGVAAGALWWRAAAIQWPRAWVALADEARWALYRAAGALWLGHVLGGVGVGAVLSGLEWLMRASPWRDWREAWPGLSRPLISSVLFALTGNAWLTAAAHLVLLGLARWLADRERGENPPGEG